MALQGITIRAIRFNNSKQHPGIRHQIGRLLYQVYIKEQRWTLEPNNPSGLRIVGNNELVDDIDETAIWFVAMKDDQSPIGCYRLADKKLIGGMHEAQRYLPKGSLSWKTIDSLYPCLEFNRIAVALPYRRSLISTILLQQMLNYIHSALPSYGLIGCTAEPIMQRIVERFGAVCVGEPFRYDKKDSQPANIYWYSPDTIVVALNRTLKKMCHLNLCETMRYQPGQV
ncbi:unnamed protein product [Rotaria magnacalcarata]|uniref:Acyl-homoserine-lactone synthase n=1 Tax=Rotaria magnacalcarata TaxID=392030 RepID=A0A815WXI2_9BILA|nr:unnamed protein product [Rotaria magnacalcarata]CAF1547489.1 unnamed protein product [Rotaria magnacalcarata]CAF3817026.1 unnamed protein product [Rotaria magnacalcarata]CAF3835662.1 unnamed protein product [Rotaria magnacalcarata]